MTSPGCHVHMCSFAFWPVRLYSGGRRSERERGGGKTACGCCVAYPADVMKNVKRQYAHAHAKRTLHSPKEVGTKSVSHVPHLVRHSRRTKL
jgi:hypothetical protein